MDTVPQNIQRPGPYTLLYADDFLASNSKADPNDRPQWNKHYYWQ